MEVLVVGGIATLTNAQQQGAGFGQGQGTFTPIIYSSGRVRFTLKRNSSAGVRIKIYTDPFNPVVDFNYFSDTDEVIILPPGAWKVELSSGTTGGQIGFGFRLSQPV